ncbi:MAG: phytoene/squalene synthase family protein [Candidatus Paceibacterota bacterium]
MKKEHKEIFKKGSKTFFYSSLFFPKEIRTKVATLYAFVRVVDDFVDTVPQKVSELHEFIALYHKAQTEPLPSHAPYSVIINDFVALSQEEKFEPFWVDAFFASMQADLSKQTYDTLEETEKYIYGSAEVIGLMMSRMMGLSPKYDKEAQTLGYAFQYINFIRDIAEDELLGRTYLPKERYVRYNLTDLKKATVLENKEAFSRFLREEIEYFELLLVQARPAFPVMPVWCRVPIRVAVLSYQYTGRLIKEHPIIVFENKVKPTKIRIIYFFIHVVCQEIIFKTK